MEFCCQDVVNYFKTKKIHKTSQCSELILSALRNCMYVNSVRTDMHTKCIFYRFRNYAIKAKDGKTKWNFKYSENTNELTKLSFILKSQCMKLKYYCMTLKKKKKKRTTFCSFKTEISVPQFY